MDYDHRHGEYRESVEHRFECLNCTDRELAKAQIKQDSDDRLHRDHIAACGHDLGDASEKLSDGLVENAHPC